MAAAAGGNMTLVSAGSRVIEPPNSYREFMSKRFRDRAPVVRYVDGVGHVFVVEGLDQCVPLGRLKSHSRRGATASTEPARFEDCDPASWDGSSRIRAQSAAGLSAEVIYPSLGLVLGQHPDLQFRRACLESYNRWLAMFCSSDATRLIGLAHIDPTTPVEGIRDLVRLNDLGFRGVLLPEWPGYEHGYEHTDWDPFFAVAAALAIPLSVHIRADSIVRAERGSARGNQLNAYVEMVACRSDVFSKLVFGGVLERHPTLQVVCIGATTDALDRHTAWMDQASRRYPAEARGGVRISLQPSEYVSRQVCIAESVVDTMRACLTISCHRRMWASADVIPPCADSVARMVAARWSNEPPELRDAALFGNVGRLYGLRFEDPNATGASENDTAGRLRQENAAGMRPGSD